MTNLLIVLQSGAGNNAGSMMNILMIVALIAIFYFFMIRPQQKKQKETRKFRESLAVKDKVITAGGIHGRITDIKDTTVTLEIAPNTRIVIEKSMIYPSAADAQSDAANAVAEKK